MQNMIGIAMHNDSGAGIFGWEKSIPGIEHQPSLEVGALPIHTTYGDANSGIFNSFNESMSPRINSKTELILTRNRFHEINAWGK